MLKVTYQGSSPSIVQGGLGPPKLLAKAKRDENEPAKAESVGSNTPSAYRPGELSSTFMTIERLRNLSPSAASLRRFALQLRVAADALLSCTSRRFALLQLGSVLTVLHSVQSVLQKSRSNGTVISYSRLS